MKHIKYILPGLLSLSMVCFVSCKKDYRNPNAATDVEIFSNPDALARVIVGIKSRYAVGASVAYYTITASALSTKEAAVLNAGNADLANIETGGSALAPNNGLITGLWSISNLISNESQKIINAAPSIADVNFRNSAQAYGHLYKALALGTMATFWEKVPIQNGPGAVFSTRVEALQAAIKLLDDASTLMSTTTIPASFTAAVGNDIDLPNALKAIAARYYNMIGDNDKAIARAASVDLSKRSAFFYNNTNPNPVFRLSLTQNNVYGIRANFGLSGSLTPNAADKRIAFHLAKNAVSGSGFFLGDATSIPLYQPGEMMLIQAEANARKSQLPQAKSFLDLVLTKMATGDVYGIGADLPAYTGPLTQNDLLDEIYKNRCIELYLGGFKLEDSRRFNRPAPASTTPERSRNFYPYPQQERDGNPGNTPADPAI
jgi:starch-binding outer membrane protein, SusD/RagB family